MLNYSPTTLTPTELVELIQELYAVKSISIVTDSPYGTIRFGTEHLLTSEYENDLYFEDDNDIVIRVVKDKIKSITLLPECELHSEIIIDMGDSKITFIVM